MVETTNVRSNPTQTAYVTDVARLLQADLKAVKWAKTDSENCLHINAKEEQKIIDGTQSPSFSGSRPSAQRQAT